MKNYEKLDAAILAKISDQPKSFKHIYLGDVWVESLATAAESGRTFPHASADPARACDRRLQALRRAGKIRSTTKGWIRVDAKGAAK